MSVVRRLPSILREIGLLKDGDEFLLGVAHRAAFHAMMCTVLLIMVNRILRGAGVMEGLSLSESIRLVAGAFLVSYLLQYWGAREGTFRIFLGAAALAVVTLLGLSLLVRARPRLSAGILVTISALVNGFLAWFSFAATPSAQPWTFVSGATQFTLLFGCTGLALWRESRSV